MLVHALPSTETRRLTMAPKLCPISCAMTCHSVRPAVLTAVPETTFGSAPVADCWHLQSTSFEVNNSQSLEKQREGLRTEYRATRSRLLFRSGTRS